MKKFKLLAALVTLLSLSSFSYALPFNIVPAAPLPTSLFPGNTVNAFYTVSSNATMTLAGNFIKYLPPNVSVVTTDPAVANLCGMTFTLTPLGSAESSCTLELKISGAVNGNDANPHNHLFVCIAGGLMCSGTTSALNISMATVPPVIPTYLAIAAGFYRTPTLVPIILQTNDLGSTFSYPVQSSSVPGDYSTVLLQGSQCCNGTSCFASYTYQNTGGGLSPLLYATFDNGLHWSTPITSQTAPSDAISPQQNALEAVACSGTNCVIAGGYETTSTSFVPNAAQSTDGGKTWNYTLTSSAVFPGDFANNGFLNSVACQGLICVAGGQYTGSGGKTYPLLAQSSNSGSTWAYKINSSSPALPGDFQNTGTFNAEVVSGNVVLAIGTYTNTSNQVIPITALSNDGGNTWAYQTIALPSDFNTVSTLFTPRVNCSGNLCILSMTYGDNASQGFPLVQVSHDHGQSWTNVVNSTYPTLPADETQLLVLTGASCNGTTCVIGCDYRSNTASENPGILLSKDSGVTWKYVVTSQTPGLPSGFVSGGFSGAACLGNFCTASGEYMTSTNGYPMLATSHDGGNTWSYMVNAQNPSLPTDYVSNGTLGGTAIGSSSFATLMKSVSKINYNYADFLVDKKSLKLLQGFAPARI